MFDEIVVLDYISNYQDLTQDQITSLAQNVIDPQFLNNCPNGTIIGQVISTASVPTGRIYYPFFSHIRVPIKAGERAWAFTPTGGRVSYWLSRKVQDSNAEDPNFTHDDRAFFASTLNPDINSKIFTDANRTGVNLQDVRSSAVSKDQFIGEPTRTIQTLAPDLALQGSNSTSIVLTNDGSAGTGKIVISAGLGSDIDASQDNQEITTTENYKSFVKPTKTRRRISSDRSSITISAALGVNITVGQASIRVSPSGDIVITPSPNGVIKLGGDDADKAILCQEAIRTGGNVEAPSIVSTAGGILGAPDLPATGQFASKILVK
jgi:hypothetical protein